MHLYEAPIYWKSTKQTSFETSTFGSEFVAVWQYREYIEEYAASWGVGIQMEDLRCILGTNQALLAYYSSQISTQEEILCYLL